MSGIKLLTLQDVADECKRAAAVTYRRAENIETILSDPEKSRRELERAKERLAVLHERARIIEKIDEQLGPDRYSESAQKLAATLRVEYLPELI